MSESLQVSEQFREFLESRQREGETMEETLRRLVESRQARDGEAEQDDRTGPHPSEVAGIISSETAEKMRERIDRLDEVDVADKRELRERFE